MSEYRRWIEAQLRHVGWLDSHPEPQLHHADELRQIIAEAGQRGSLAGLPAAVRACEIRAGVIAPNVAREILAACLGAIEPAGDIEYLSVIQASELLNVKPRTVYDLTKTGRLPHNRVGTGRGAIRIKRADIEAYQKPVDPPRLKYL